MDQQVCRCLLYQHFPTAMTHAEGLHVDVSLVASQWCECMLLFFLVCCG